MEIGVSETIEWLEAEAKVSERNKPERLREAKHYVELYLEYKNRLDWLLEIVRGVTDERINGLESSVLIREALAREK